jgi:hypothetical protein
VQMHFIGGSAPLIAPSLDLASSTTAGLASPATASTSCLRINQRMRLEPSQLEPVHARMKVLQFGLGWVIQQ